MSIAEDIAIATEAALDFAADIRQVPPEVMPIVAVSGDYVVLAGAPRVAIPDLLAGLDIEEKLRELVLAQHKPPQGGYLEHVVLVMVLLDIEAAWEPPNLRHLGAMKVATVPKAPGPRGVS